VFVSKDYEDSADALSIGKCLAMMAMFTRDGAQFTVQLVCHPDDQDLAYEQDQISSFC
jgi:hypothetical protein